MNNKDLLQKAKNYAFLLLKFRAHSEKELYQRLKRKKFEEKIIKEVIAFLKEKDFINDAYFTKAWIDSRLKKPLGFRRIKQELQLKGIDREIIDSQMQEIKKGYCEEEIVRKLSQDRFKRLKRNIEPQKAKSRIFSYLLRRGFSPEIVMDVMSQL